jgi:hypothetical protein
VRAGLRGDPVYIAEMLGHVGARYTLRVYAKAVKRRSKLSGPYLAEFDRTLSWAALSTPGETAQNGTGTRLESKTLLRKR